MFRVSSGEVIRNKTLKESSSNKDDLNKNEGSGEEILDAQNIPKNKTDENRDTIIKERARKEPPNQKKTPENYQLNGKLHWLLEKHSNISRSKQ